VIRKSNNGVVRDSVPAAGTSRHTPHVGLLKKERAQ